MLADRVQPLGLVSLACGAALWGCGGSSDGLAPAAEPAGSPPLERRPAGRVFEVGNKPEGMVADARD